MAANLGFSIRASVLFLFLILPLVAINAPMWAAGPREDLVVTAAWLNQHLKDPELVLLHVGDPNEYKQRHLPGAQLVDLMDISAPMDHSGADTKTLALELPAPSDLRDRLARFGISDNSTIVVYYGNDWYSPATRVVFTLTYAGLGGRTRLLDGGTRAWVAAGFSTTADVPASRAGTLSPLKTVDSVVDAAFVQSKLNTPGVVIVDGRDKVFYDGLQSGGSRNTPPVLGHIPGAISIPFTEIFDDGTGLLQPAAKLATLFAQAGVKPGEEVIGYCHIGQQATAVLFAARTLGYKVRLYDGSMNDWSQRGLPVQKEK
jgi:thiosulfate/3-mercaptopyruvate sulfurtransferase